MVAEPRHGCRLLPCPHVLDAVLGITRSLSPTKLVYGCMSSSPRHPKEQEPQVLRRASFPRSTGLPVLGWATRTPCSCHNLPEQGLMSLRHQTPHCTQQKFVEPKMLEITLTKIFPSEMFPWRLNQQGERRESQLWGVRVSVGRDGTAPLPCCASTDSFWLPTVTCRQIHWQIHWFYLPLLLCFLPIPPSSPAASSFFFSASLFIIPLQQDFLYWLSS